MPYCNADSKPGRRRKRAFHGQLSLSMHIFMGTHATEEMRSTFEPSVVFMKFPREGKHFATSEGQSFPLEDMLTRKRATRIPMSILEGAARGLSLASGRLAGGAEPGFLTTGDTNQTGVPPALPGWQ
jgi:hypothetical protein